MASELTIGMIGLDTSHSPAFTKLLTDKSDPNHVPGTKVIAGFPGGVDDFEPSYSRVDKFTQQLKDEYGLEILDSPEAVAEKVDLIMITSADGRAHRGFFEKVAPAGKPVFIDKPLACSFDDAVAIYETASQHNVPLMTCSSLRYADVFQAALKESDSPIKAVDTFGPMVVFGEQSPGYFWYGVHQVEMAVTALGAGAAQVQAVKTEFHDVALVTWDDGRSAVIHGQREVNNKFGAAIHREDGPSIADFNKSTRPYYAMMLEQLVATLPHGKQAVPADEALSIVAIMEAANESREAGGKPVDVRRASVSTA